ncbi:protein kinase [Streptomyces sp. NPDC050658]|uniref:serine/threonine-protein kinase n=1 Tax=unclassified Streptomyces TaxID=2593676 RepID=UPI0034281F38
MPDNPIAGRYELLEPLSHGGMGDVWRGYDSVLDRPVAVKLIRQQSVTSPTLAEEFAKRFKREARITARIQHPGVPQVYDAVLDDTYEHLYLVMELVDGVPLTAYIHPALHADPAQQARPPLPISWAAAVAAQVATVLSWAHDVPVIHRDLKPGNILVARDGTVKVLDFGIAAMLRTDVTKLTATGSPIGTYQYMSPEQVWGGRVTPQADLYALGCVLHELLSGCLVFTADSEYMLMYQHVNAEPTPLRKLRHDVPADLEALVLHLLRKAPEERPADIQEVYERLQPFLPSPGEEPVPQQAVPGQVPDPTGIFRRPYAPRPRAGAAQSPYPAVPDAPAAPAPLPEALRAQIKEVHAHYAALMEEERYAQAAEVVGEMAEPAARALGSDNKAVLGLRMRRSVSLLLGGDFRAALPEFDALADAYARTGGPTSRQALDCRAQAARCRAELGQVTDALAALRDVLDAVRSVDSDVSEDAVVLRRDIGMLLLAQGRAAEALELLEPLHSDLLLVLGPDDELTAEIAETLAVVRLDLDGPASG